MTESKKFNFDHPELSSFFGDNLDRFFNESQRGAILIATALLEDQLTDLIMAILPRKEKKYVNKLMNYPGPLSSFSSKLNLAYAFRLISEQLFESLDELRKVRNEAAHSKNEFSIEEFSSRMKSVYMSDSGWEYLINKMAAGLWVDFKFHSFKHIFKDQAESEEELVDLVKEALVSEKGEKAFKEQLPHYELLYGTYIIASFLLHTRDELKERLKGSTWASE